MQHQNDLLPKYSKPNMEPIGAMANNPEEKSS